MYLIATFEVSAAQSNQATASKTQLGSKQQIGVVPWESATQRFRKRFLDRGGSTNWKNKAGPFGNGSYIACNAVRFAGRKRWAKRINERNSLWVSSFAAAASSLRSSLIKRPNVGEQYLAAIMRLVWNNLHAIGAVIACVVYQSFKSSLEHGSEPP